MSKKRAVLLAGAAFVFGVNVAGASADYPSSFPQPPSECEVVAFFSQDDLSAVAECPGGVTLVKDDGPEGEWSQRIQVGVRLIGPDRQGEYHLWPVYRYIPLS